MNDERGPAANWYRDPVEDAELRWFDGDAWTAHVSGDGRTWTSRLYSVHPPPAHPVPPSGAGRSLLAVDRLVVARPAQPRGQGAWLDLYDDEGTLGRTVETTSADLIDAVIATVSDGAGAPLLSITHPGSVARARVDAGGGRTLGFVARLGRVRANWEVHGPGRVPAGRTLATLRPLEGAGAAWEARSPGDDLIVRLRAWSLGLPTTATYGEARYELEIGPAADDSLRPLLLALPVLADRTSQAVRGSSS